MSLLQRLGFGRNHMEDALLEERVTALQAALAKCKGVAMHWRRVQTELIVGLSIAMLALGFALGVYREPLMQGIADVLRPIGLVQWASDLDAGHAAYQDGDYATARTLLRPVAQNGDARAQSTLALLYYQGNGVPRDYGEALHWFRQAADQGDARAQFNLGVMYSEAQGVPQDHAEAAKWYRLAADQAYAPAQYNLGLWYGRGEGGSPDYVNAHMWFNLAASRFPPAERQNRSEAIRNRELVAGKMTSEQIAQAQKLAREWKPK